MDQQKLGETHAKQDSLDKNLTSKPKWQTPVLSLIGKLRDIVQVKASYDTDGTSGKGNLPG